MKNLMLVAAFALALSPAAFAKGKGSKGGSAQTHHCEMNGVTVSKTKKACTKGGGTWAKGAPAADATTPPATK